ncbi:hypothetical protein BKA08_003487 [Nocardioides marinisabuli]|uniref:Right handed beta helix domain-containing protein n=1 Tax=Nocardioides marinisabuli TaxID=419476 RepID=A0A7Y9F426_9ACTN|nr:right-handed parallel beta-helix repeat-containing protein [Nocardioides marinisabuli]NYD59249.1 hypothetical protein [Nocardioides marinisabuli]
MRFAVRLLCLSLIAFTLTFAASSPVAAHEERESQFPAGDGTVPTKRSLAQAADVIVVCKADSRKRIKKLPGKKLRAFNLKLLKQCEHRHMQAAVDAVKKQRTNIYVLPGLYREQPSWDKPCMDAYEGGIVEYDFIVSCGEVVNLVTIAGDDPDDPDIKCDNQLCDLQMIGTGASPRDVTLRGGYREDGDWIKHNGIKADRADGFYLSNMRAMLFRENAFYVHETDGYVLDRFEGSHNDLYGVLTFTSDHGVISNCNAHHNGDSGVYPGSAADVNSTSRNTGPLNRWATEVVNCNLHHNALGMSGTAGNSLYVHNNRIHHNGLGFIVESILGGHPGMPQDHGWFEDNKIYSNNENYYEKYVQGEDAPCQSRVAREVGHHKGVVCPAFGFPVGTGGIIVGNHNFINSNQVWDNWRQGFMLFWVPPALLRGDYNPLHQQDNSNHNAFTKNELGYSPKGKVLPNGIDFYWDEAGDGNCWQDNLTAPGKEVTHNYAIDLPDCGNPSQWPIGNLIKTTQLIPCATYDRRSEPDPAGCDWLDTPEKPSSDSGSAGSRASEQPGDGPGAPAALLAVTLVGTLGIRLASARRQRAKADQ